MPCELTETPSDVPFRKSAVVATVQNVGPEALIVAAPDMTTASRRVVRARIRII
jgi:hypothetical protein